MPVSPSPFLRPLERLAGQNRWTYRASRHSSAEPAAWTTIALAAHGMSDAALPAANWLANLQLDDGSVPTSPRDQADAHNDTAPRWPTALALLAWSAANRGLDTPRFRSNIAAAVKWALENHGETAPRSPQVGHDTMLKGWSWAADTHSWLEPSAMFVLGLRAAGSGDHPRVREGVRLLVDRLLPSGGANYGNTTVFGQELLPHIQPTGLALLALSGEDVADPRVERSLKLLEASATPSLAPDSFAYALMALTAHNRRPPNAAEQVLERFERRPAASLAAYDRALLLAAAAGAPDAVRGSVPRRGSNND